MEEGSRDATGEHERAPESEDEPRVALEAPVLLARPRVTNEVVARARDRCDRGRHTSFIGVREGRGFPPPRDSGDVELTRKGEAGSPGPTTMSGGNVLAVSAGGVTNMRRSVLVVSVVSLLLSCAGTASAGLLPGPGLLPLLPPLLAPTKPATAPAPPAPSPAPAPVPAPPVTTTPAPPPPTEPAPAPAAPQPGSTSGSGGLLQGLLGGGCGATSPVFAPWGDGAGYYFAPNGGFESAASSWTLGGGSSVVAANEPWRLGGAGSHALQVPKGGSAATTVCYGLTYPGVRFFVTGVRGTATVHVRVIARSLLGVLSILDGGSFTAGTAWAPSPRVSTLFSAVAAPVGAKSMQLQFTVESGTARIDDLFVDPLLLKS